MRQLKTFSHDLQKLFTQSITVREIAEPLVSFDAERVATTVQQFMKDKDFDYIGVRQDGLAVGYALRTCLTEGTLGDHLIKFWDEDVIPAHAPLLDALEALKSPDSTDDFKPTQRVFVATWNKVGGIVTWGDLQKAPVRLWLFGLITLTEMQMLRIIRAGYRNDSWQSRITQGRLDKAKEILDDRRSRNEGVELVECLEFCDKRELIVKNDALRNRLGLGQRKEARLLLEDLEHLRNELAHAQPIPGSRRSTLLCLAKRTANLLQEWETTSVSDIAIG